MIIDISNLEFKNLWEDEKLFANSLGWLRFFANLKRVI